MIKLVIKAGQAKPGPPVGAALGQAGLKIMEFVKDFNARTADIKVERGAPESSNAALCMHFLTRLTAQTLRQHAPAPSVNAHMDRQRGAGVVYVACRISRPRLGCLQTWLPSDASVVDGRNSVMPCTAKIREPVGRLEPLRCPVSSPDSGKCTLICEPPRAGGGSDAGAHHSLQ